METQRFYGTTTKLYRRLMAERGQRVVAKYNELRAKGYKKTASLRILSSEEGVGMATIEKDLKRAGIHDTQDIATSVNQVIGMMKGALTILEDLKGKMSKLDRSQALNSLGQARQGVENSLKIMNVAANNSRV